MHVSFLVLLSFLGGTLLADSMFSPPVDRFGQAVQEDWPGKIAEESQLRMDAAREAETLATVVPPAGYDRFGGRIEARKFKATGYFRLEKVDGRWWFVSPEGNLFFLQGVDAVSWRENGYNTPICGQNGQPRPELTQLPSRNEFPAAYHTPGKVNFLAANLQRKYGADFSKKVREVARQRLLKWGFNSTAKWGWGETIGLPYIEDSHAGNVTRVSRLNSAIDPYDPQFEAKIEPAVKKVCDRRRLDPMLIAYSMENENGWSEEVVDEILRQTGKSFAKKAFLDFLQQEQIAGGRSIGELFGMPGKSGDELLKTELKCSPELLPAVRKFINQSSRKYHRILAGLFRKHDPNHLFMGAAHCPKQSIDWYEGAAESLDFLGFNIYALDLAWIRRDMERLRKADKPFTVLEYSFVTESRGYPPYSGTNTVMNQKDRGVAFRYFTENAATNPLCIGFGYFIYWDQSVARRSLPNGEAFNFGLVNQCDQPYDEMLAEVMIANSRLFELHKGHGNAFALENPRRLLGSVRSRKLTEVFLPGTMSEEVITDPSNPQYFNGETARLKVNEGAVQGPGVFYAGVTGSGEGQRFTGFSLTGYLWKKSGDQNPANHFVVEESSDGKHYTAVALRSRLVKPCEFNEHELTNAEPLRGNTIYLRIGVRVEIPGQSWAAQIGKIRLQK